MSPYQQLITASVAAVESLRGLESGVTRAAGLITDCLAGGRKLLACGNGGSAADAAHLATEFVVRFDRERRPYPAIALSDSGSTLTAAGNDYEFAEVFARQVNAFAQPGDVLVAISTSGRSSNVIKALDAARCAGIESIALLGRDGGPAKGLATVDLIVADETTARIQEAHAVLIHALLEDVEARLADRSG